MYILSCAHISFKINMSLIHPHRTNSAPPPSGEAHRTDWEPLVYVLFVYQRCCLQAIRRWISVNLDQ
jgi:hypothetical protein